MLTEKTKVLITGVTSIHGWPIYKRLARLLPHARLFAIRSPKMSLPQGPNVLPLCIMEAETLARVQRDFQPTHVIHAAGVCDLDVCEERPHWAKRLNVEGTRTMLKVFARFAHFMYLSTDLIFSGIDPPENGYCEEHLPRPLSVAGKTFRAAEELVLQHRNTAVVRLGLPLGPSLTGDKGAFDWTESRFRRGLPVTLFYDEIRSCLDCESLAYYVISLLKNEVKGIFHLGEEIYSLYDIGRQVLSRGPYDPRLLRGIFRAEEKKGPPRMGRVVMNCQKAFRLLGKLAGKGEMCELPGGASAF